MRIWYSEYAMNSNIKRWSNPMEMQTTQLVLVSKPGLICNSLLSYFRSLAAHSIQSTTLAPADYLSLAGHVAADIVIVNEEDKPGEVDQIMQMESATNNRLVVIVKDMTRRRELQQKKNVLVLVWGLLDKNFEQFLIELIPPNVYLPALPHPISQ
jgi:hypothetical protein